MRATTVILPAIVLGVLAPVSIASAQTYQPSNRVPVADNTLGSQVTGTNNNFAITGGVNRGQNLFHSFQDFSVPTGGAATFINPVGNQSIITRVTGNLGSDINGIVNTNGANFFLINPNGVVFGSNAQLNVGRIFAASTANGIDLVDGAGRAIVFGTNPSGDAPLLAINPNVLFNVAQFNLGGGTGEIRNFGTLQPGNPNQYIGLIGGNVNINGGQINAPGGKIELGGLAAAGQVGFTTVGDMPRLSFPTGVARFSIGAGFPPANVALTNKSTVNVAGAGGGDVVINARNINLSGDSVIRAGIEQGQGTPTTVAGTVRLNATGGIAIDTNSAVVNNVRVNGQGKGGDIIIAADTLAIRDQGSAIQAGTYGRGDTGDIRVKIAGNIDFSGANAGINTLVGTTGVGNGGNVSIETGSLSLQAGAKLAAATIGQGNAGSITVNAQNTVALAGADIVSAMEEGVGTGGNIDIKADSISLRQGATITASTFAVGNAGNVTLTARNAISLADPNTTIFSSVEPGSSGNGGKISIDSKSVSLANGAQLNAANSGTGNAGSIAISATDLVSLSGTNTIVFSTIEAGGVGNGGKISIDAGGVALSDGAQLRSLSRGKGDAGDVSITARQAVTLTGQRTAIFNTIDTSGAGKGGNISIDAGSVLLNNGSLLAASNTGTGNAGNVQIRATGAVDIIGTKSPNLIGGISSVVGNGTVGNGGNITIDARAFRLQDSAALIAGNIGQGNSGAIKISTADSVLLSGTGGLFVTTSSTSGTGGDITIASPQIVLDRGTRINAGSLSGNGGNIRLGTNLPTTDLLLLRNGAQVATDAAGTAQQGGNGGNINVNAQFVAAVPTENSDITANAVKGSGGNVNINAQGLFGTQLRPRQTSSSDITASSDLGQSGNIVINTPGIDPGKDLGELPTVPTDASKQISQTCNTDRADNKLYITGNGGHPQTTDDLLTNDVVWLDARGVAAPAVVRTQPTQKLPQPAVAWVFDGRGKVTLMASKEGDVRTTNVVCPNR